MEVHVRNNVRFDVFCLKPNTKVFVHFFFAENIVTDIVCPDMLENFFMLIAHARLFQSERGLPLFTLNFRWDISEAALTFDRLVPPNLKHLNSSVGTQIGTLLTFPHFPPFHRNCCEDWTDAATDSNHTDKCAK